MALELVMKMIQRQILGYKKLKYICIYLYLVSKIKGQEIKIPHLFFPKVY